jgi:hypothetical protein
MPLRDAFEHLASLQPQLRTIADRAIASSDTSASMDDYRGVLGPGAATDEAVLKTDFAINLVNDYIGERTGRALPGQDLSTPFFERRLFSFTNSFFLFGIGERRPRAEN